MSKSHSKNEEKGEAQFRKNRKFAESRSALCPLRSQRPLPPCFARGIGRPTYLFSPPKFTPTHEAISTSRSHCPAEPERRRTNAYIHRQAHGGARRQIGHHRTLTATVYLTEHNGKVDLELRNFVFKAGSGDPLGIGNIKLSNLPLTDEGEKSRSKVREKPPSPRVPCRALRFGWPVLRNPSI